MSAANQQQRDFSTAMLIEDSSLPGNGSRATICLTFDFDAVSLWLSRRMTTPTPVSRGEFGVHVVPRLLDMLADRSLSTTWFIPGHTVETFPEACREILDAGHEIALHSYSHDNVAALERSVERDDFARSYEVVSELVGSPPRGYRAPAWDLSPNTLSLLIEFGVVYDSSLMSHDYSVFHPRDGDEVRLDGPMKLGARTGLVEIPVSWVLDDYPQFEYVRMPGGLLPGLRAPDHVFGIWAEEARYMSERIDDGVMTVTLHPQVIGRGHRLLGLERWLDNMLDRDIAFERMDAVAEAFLSGRCFGRYRPRRVPSQEPE